MKKILLITGVVALALTADATVFSYNFNGLNVAIPDANPVGVANSQTVGGIPAQIDGQDASIVNVEVQLNLTGGFNGDLYGYLVLQSADSSTSTAILLNRIGQDLSNPFGNTGSGISVTLSGSGTGDIHNAGFGSVSGTYTPDGNSGALTVFNGHNANGTWTLFLADLAGGDTATLDSWGLTVSVVPEPVTWALAIFLVVALSLLAFRQRAQIVRP